MRRSLGLIVAMIAVCSSIGIGQDDSEQRMRKALVGRSVLVKMDLPAVNSGIDFVLDDTDVSYNTTNCNNLLKEYGVAVKNGARAKITGVRVSTKGIELDLDGGGLPGNDWVVGKVKLVGPEPLAISERELELERQIRGDPNPAMAFYLRSEIEYERQLRAAQDDRNREVFKRAELQRRKYFAEHRTKWGTKVVFVVRSRKESIKMRDMVKALAKYVELLPSEKPAE